MNNLPHITVATIVQRNGLFLMVEEFDNGKRVINQPAGHLETGETLIEAAVRETLEETGWMVELEHLVGIYQYHAAHQDISTVRLAFKAKAIEQLRTSIDPDISEVLWMGVDEIRQRETRSPMVIQCINDAGSNSGSPLSLIEQL